mmetsp:Transcript_1276/g.3590  ORF Transcript_1276/g.3590 Transcript_1276/m.3590 type:complete len:282 (+) Transcript_1276:383-1228(+)
METPTRPCPIPTFQLLVTPASGSELITHAPGMVARPTCVWIAAWLDARPLLRLDVRLDRCSPCSSRGCGLVFGSEGKQQSALRHDLAFRGVHASDHDVRWRLERVLHLHRLEHDQRLASAHRLTFLNEYTHDLAGHRRMHSRLACSGAGCGGESELGHLGHIHDEQPAAFSTDEQVDGRAGAPCGILRSHRSCHRAALDARAADKRAEGPIGRGPVDETGCAPLECGGGAILGRRRDRQLECADGARRRCRRERAFSLAEVNARGVAGRQSVEVEGLEGDG